MILAKTDNELFIESKIKNELKLLLNKKTLSGIEALRTFETMNI